MNTNEEFPRRSRIDLFSKAEKAIYDAQQAVEKAGADERLTKATILLSEARDAVADFIDDGLTKDQIEVGKIYLHSSGRKVKVCGKENNYIPISCLWINDDGSYGGAFNCVPGYLILELTPQ